MKPNHFFFPILFSAALFLSPVHAATANLSGTVLNESGAPVDGAEVKLQSDESISTTTDSEGRFQLTGEITSVLRDRKKSLVASAALNGFVVDVNLTTPSDITISAYSLAGRKVYDYNTEKLDAGQIRIALPINRLGAGVYLITVHHEGNRSVFKYVSSLKRNFGFTGHNRKTDVSAFALRKTAAQEAEFVDTLLITAEGYHNTEHMLVSYAQDDIEILLKAVDYGEWVVTESSLTDLEGNVYTTVRIGNQVWTVNNLRTTRYADGTAIPHVTEQGEWRRLKTPAYCYHKNTTYMDSVAKYGALYNWWVVDSANPKKLAPEGWRVPTDADWDALRDHLIVMGHNWDGTYEGHKIAKAMASAGGEWDSSSNQGTIGNDQRSNNSSGFSALPGLYRWDFGDFSIVNREGCTWWSSAEYDPDAAHTYALSIYYEGLSGHYDDKNSGYSVRLVRDVAPDTFTVTFETNGAAAVDPVELAYGSLLERPTRREKADSTFYGWYRDPQLTQEWNFVENRVTADMTLYAGWWREIVEDGGGNKYNTLRIGEQVWTVENLRTAMYADGTPIPLVTESDDWETLSTPAVCFYQNISDRDVIEIIGGLYNWWAIDLENEHSLAPEGWRVPADEDWTILQDYLIANGYNWDATTHENKIAKAIAFSGGVWEERTPEGVVGHDQEKNNSSGFSGFPAGTRTGYGSFSSFSGFGVWWSTTQSDTSEAYLRRLRYDSEFLERRNFHKRSGYSVRLVRDLNPATEHTVTFNTQGGSSVAPQELITGGLVTEPSPASHRPGYTFEGWFSDEDYTSAWDFSSNTVSGNITLFAKWSEIVAEGEWIVSEDRLTDPDGNVYSTVSIGNQVWMVENLRTTRYADGTPIPHAIESGGNNGWNNYTPAYCYYNNTTDTNIIAKYGALYNWLVVDPENEHSIAPDGWRVPTQGDWQALRYFIDPELNDVGGKMKTTGTADWAAPNTGATNESGFCALPGGYRNGFGYFEDFGHGGYWLSDRVGWYCHLSYLDADMDIPGIENIDTRGFSVRLVRDK